MQKNVQKLHINVPIPPKMKPVLNVDLNLEDNSQCYTNLVCAKSESIRVKLLYF